VSGSGLQILDKNVEIIYPKQKEKERKETLENIILAYRVGTGTVLVDPGCLSRILIFTHHESRIQKPQQKRGVKKIVVIPFFVSTNFTKLKIIVFLKC
jgi:hypothetical protein